MPDNLNRWDCGTKRVVLASAAAAVAFQAWHSAEWHPYLLRTLLVVPVLTYLVGRKIPETSAGIVMAAGYFVPTALILITGLQQPYFSVWAAILLTTIAGTVSPGWHSPPRFRFAMCAWGLTVALTWPLVAWRELDWTLGVLFGPPITRSSNQHTVPTALWVAQIATTHLVGLLWLDWLLARFRDGDAVGFERRIIRPLLGAAVAAALLAIYQGHVTLEFPRQSLWAAIGRASGALDDANASGALLALWVAVPLAITLGRARWQQALLALVSIVLLLGLWETQSRTALLCAVVGLIGVGHAAFLRSRHRLRLAALMLAAVVAAAALAVFAFRTGSQNTVTRMQDYVHFFNAGGVRQVGRELWVRNGYGTAAMEMIRDEPLQGVGVGTYSVLSGDYGRQSGSPLPTDNAQNWFRHQLAELGAIGCVGVLAWSLALVAALFARPHVDPNRDRTLIVKYALAGFGLISLVGMPSLNLFVAMTVWTFCAWLFLRLGAGDERYRPAAADARLPFIAASIVAVVAASLTAYAGWHSLRPPYRAARFDYPYSVGFYAPIEDPTGQTLTTRTGVIVPRAHTGLLKLTLWVDHPDADARPVQVELWVNHKRYVRGRFARSVPLTRYIPVPSGKRFVLETALDRTYPGAAPNPEVGLNVRWAFVSGEQ